MSRYGYDERQKHETPYVTFSLIAVNALAFVAEISLTSSQRADLLLTRGVVPGEWQQAFANVLTAPPSLWLTLLTAQFLHVGWLHFLTNMLALLAAGARVEEKFGGALFAAFYFVCGALAFLVHIFIVRGESIPALGSSGAVSGVLAAYVLVSRKARVFVPLGGSGQTVPLVLLVGLWFIAQWLAGLAAVIPSSLGANIALWIPVSGLGLGLALTYGITRYRERRQVKHLVFYNPYDNPNEEYRPPRPRTRMPYDNEDEDLE